MACCGDRRVCRAPLPRESPQPQLAFSWPCKPSPAVKKSPTSLKELYLRQGGHSRSRRKIENEFCERLHLWVRGVPVEQAASPMVKCVSHPGAGGRGLTVGAGGGTVQTRNAFPRQANRTQSRAPGGRVHRLSCPRRSLPSSRAQGWRGGSGSKITGHRAGSELCQAPHASVAGWGGVQPHHRGSEASGPAEPWSLSEEHPHPPAAATTFQSACWCLPTPRLPREAGQVAGDEGSTGQIRAELSPVETRPGTSGASLQRRDTTQRIRAALKQAFLGPSSGAVSGR